MNVVQTSGRERANTELKNMYFYCFIILEGILETIYEKKTCYQLEIFCNHCYRSKSIHLLGLS